MEVVGHQGIQSTFSVVDQCRDLLNVTALMKHYQDYRVSTLELDAEKVRACH